MGGERALTRHRGHDTVPNPPFVEQPPRMPPLGAGMRLRGRASKGGFRCGRDGGYGRLEQRFGRQCLAGTKRFEGRWGRTEATGSTDRHARERGGGGMGMGMLKPFSH